jgi:hypothetical protein
MLADTKKTAKRLFDVVPVLKEEEVIQTWDWACTAMLGVCVGLNEIFGGTVAGQNRGRLQTSIKALTTRNVDDSQ